jgi:hypothetical protein
MSHLSAKYETRKPQCSFFDQGHRCKKAPAEGSKHCIDHKFLDKPISLIEKA